MYTDGLFLLKSYEIISQQILVEIYARTLKGNAKTKEKLTCGLKNDLINLVNFHSNNQKFGNLHFDWLVLSKPYKDWDEKVQKTLKSDAKFEK